jgi:major type 1 subunit fimbrin (pilin)
MNRKILGCAALATSALSTSAAYASDGAITFNGRISTQTCDISGDGGGTSFTVTLPTLSTGAFSSPGPIMPEVVAAGRTEFDIELSNCQPQSGNVSAFFEIGATVDVATGRLKNMAWGADAAEGIQIQILNVDGTPISLGKAASGSGTAQGAKAFALRSGAAKLSYAAEYAVGPYAVPGLITSSVVYSIRYN